MNSAQKGRFGEGPAPACSLRCLACSTPANYGFLLGSLGLGFILLQGTPDPPWVSTAPGSACPVAALPSEIMRLASVLFAHSFKVVVAVIEPVFSSTWELVVCISS